MNTKVGLTTSRIVLMLQRHKSKVIVLVAFCLAVMGLAAGASIFSTGFESGNLSDWSGVSGNCTVAESAAHTGKYGLKIQVVDSKGGAIEKSITGNQNDIYVRFYFKLENGYVDPNAKTRIAEAWYPPKGSRHMLNLWYPKGKFSLNYASQTAMGGGGGWKDPMAEVSVGEWHHVELRVTLGPKGGGAFWFDGKKISEYAADFTGCGPIATVDVGPKIYGPGENGIFDIDDVSIESAASPSSRQGNIFSSGELADVMRSGDTANPVGDEIAKFVKHALGLNL
jgi:hypothetical protein